MHLSIYEVVMNCFSLYHASQEEGRFSEFECGKFFGAGSSENLTETGPA